MKKKKSAPKKTKRLRKQIPNPDLIRFGEEVRRRRVAQDISQEELGFVRACTATSSAMSNAPKQTRRSSGSSGSRGR
jgi:hypothetical protein